MTPLESRKRLLLAESELNRIQMAEELTALVEGSRALVENTKSFTSILSSAAVLWAAFRRRKRPEHGGKRSWLQILLKGAGLVSTFWLAFQSQARAREKS